MRLQDVTYLGYVWNYLRQENIKYNWFKLKSSLFSDLQFVYKFLDDAYILLHKRKVM